MEKSLPGHAETFRIPEIFACRRHNRHIGAESGSPRRETRIIYVGTYAEFMIEFLPEFMPEEREMFPILYNGDRNRKRRR